MDMAGNIVSLPNQSGKMYFRSVNCNFGILVINFHLKIKKNSKVSDSPTVGAVTVVKEPEFYRSQSTQELKTQIDSIIEGLEEELVSDLQSNKLRKLKRLVDYSLNTNLEYEKKQKYSSDDSDS